MCFEFEPCALPARCSVFVSARGLSRPSRGGVASGMQPSRCARRGLRSLPRRVRASSQDIRSRLGGASEDVSCRAASSLRRARTRRTESVVRFNSPSASWPSHQPTCVRRVRADQHNRTAAPSGDFPSLTLSGAPLPGMSARGWLRPRHAWQRRAGACARRGSPPAPPSARFGRA
jgi:hypothetical protein